MGLPAWWRAAAGAGGEAFGVAGSFEPHSAGLPVHVTRDGTPCVRLGIPIVAQTPP